MSVFIATATTLLSRTACSCLKLDRKGIPNTGGIGYCLDRAVVVVEGATLATFVTGTITMLIIGRTLGIGSSVVQRVVLETT
jgi:hypothetical protein